jgi:uncharacterized protein (DUF2236 family)
MQSLRHAIKRHVLAAVGSGRPAAARPRSVEGGLFGPTAVSRRVHGDVGSMMIGGVGALLLQMLHPGALGGVWDHSDFRSDMAGRLRRTARFISVTTYGSKTEAEEMIGRVRRAHDGVRGRLPDGSPYDANDPALLTWVHVAEVTCFLAAHLRYRDPFLSRADQDRYLAETAVVAQALGAGDVPVTRRAAEDYLLAMRPALRADARTAEVRRALLSQRPSNLALAPFYGVLFEAGVDLLPRWAARMHGLRQRPSIRPGALGVGAALRWAMAADAGQAA